MIWFPYKNTYFNRQMRKLTIVEANEKKSVEKRHLFDFLFILFIN